VPLVVWHKGVRLKRPFILVVLLWVAATTAAVSAPLIEEQQRLNFGRLAIGDNTTISRFTYPRTGLNINILGHFVLISSGSPGRYHFSGFPAYTTLNVSLNNTSLTANGSGIPEPLSVDNYDFGTLVTDALGQAELMLGARLSTSGNGGSYGDAPYSGSTVLRVDYWQPDVKAYVTNTQAIDLEAELSSTLAIDEVQQLNFGTLYASSSNTVQAVLTLSPSGSYSLSEPGNSRLVSIIRPSQGIMRVSGAAPYYGLTITPQAGDVLLEHTTNPGSAPHFILSALQTSPNGTGTTDVNGELLIKIGGTLKTELTAAPEVYPSGQYQGTYQLTVSY
jgi:hypothetical protein